MSVGLTWPWAGALVLTAAVVVGVVAVVRRRPRVMAARWVARTADLAQVPEIRRALRRVAALRAASALAVLVAVVAAAVLVARPVQTRVHDPRDASRDIVLCLDVSGSMLEYDVEVVRTFERLLDGFDGERIALSVFNSTSRTVFPLTDDYALVRDELAAAAEVLAYDETAEIDPDDDEAWDRLQALWAFVAGTMGVPDEGSLIGDGVASCGLLFDEQGSERSRSVVLATDNMVNGRPIYRLSEAVSLLAERDVALYSLFTGPAELRDGPEYVEMENAVAQSRDAVGFGGMWFTGDPAAVAGVVEDVDAQQEQALDGRATTFVVDRPGAWPLLLVGAVGVLLVLRWRTRS